ncbi:hypothetical protein Tco_0306189, partial [Tanacetum coccineum]
MKSRNWVNSYAARITKMIADIEDRHHGLEQIFKKRNKKKAKNKQNQARNGKD